MRVLQIINSLATGGAEKLILETIPLLRTKGILIDLLVLNGTDYPYMKKLKELNCCTIYSLGNGSLFNPYYVFKIIPYLKKYDLVHVHLFPAQYYAAIAKILSFSKTKLIFTEHSTSNRRILNKRFKYIERFVYSYYIKIVCITKEVKEVVELYTKLPEDRFQVITNGVDLKSISKALPLNRNEIHSSIKEDDILIIQIAGFRIEKDQKTVIRAMTYLENNVKLVLVGDGALRNECEKLVKELFLQDRVLFLGVRTDIAGLLKTATVSVVSSHWEGFGLAAVEGMAVGKPVVVSNVEGLSNVVNGSGLLFEKGNERELAKIISELLLNEDYYNSVGKACFERAKQYDITYMVDKQINLYSKLLSDD